ncbi:uncharacterized protein LOC111025963, partial [Momordica charantia]|uniref:Uncharacterized protein LOC111025963 n=1 Tax=Momordica charantia TaxID=3673 RepID=A0A6J1DZ94_MOMCH
MSSSDLFVHDDSSSSGLFRCSTSDLVFPSDAELQFFSDPYSPNLSDSAIDILQVISDQEQPLAADDSNSNSVDHFLVSSSHQFQGLTLSNRDDFHLQHHSSNGFQNLSNFDVKNEESPLGFSSDAFNPPLCFDNAADKSFLQRSFSDKPPFKSRLESLLMESPNFHNHSIAAPDSDFFSSQIRRVFSTGDLQNSGMGRSG